VGTDSPIYLNKERETLVGILFIARRKQRIHLR